MKSPFPGMDPYLEEHWEDVHTRLIGYVADELQPQLSEDLVARMEEKVYVEDESDFGTRKPDVRVVYDPVPWSPAAGQAGTAVIDQPMLLEPFGDPIRQRSVLIYDSAGNRVVTAIEIVSPWNKVPGKGRNQYLEKRDQYLQSEINLVEIDLVRTGNWMEMIGPYRVPKNGRSVYRVTVVTPEATGPLHWPISLRAALPTIKVPLRPADPEAKLDLQKLIEKAYTMGRYNRTDYTKPCHPPLDEPDREWLEGLLAGRAESAR
jgi:hypothetical protein